MLEDIVYTHKFLHHYNINEKQHDFRQGIDTCTTNSDPVGKNTQERSTFKKTKQFLRIAVTMSLGELCA